MFRTNHRRKPHRIHMAVSDIKWSDNIYGIKYVIKNYKLPLLVKVTQGHFSGPDEDSLGQGQVFRLANRQKIKRVKARDVRGRIITLPIHFPVPLGILPANIGSLRGKPTKLRQLKLADLIRRYQLPQRVMISGKHFSKRELIIPGVDLISDTIDLIEITEDVVVQGNAINLGVLDETVLNIPLRNTEMEVIVGLGLRTNSQQEWDTLNAGLTEKFNRKVKLPKITDGKGVLIIHQIPSHKPRPIRHQQWELQEATPYPQPTQQRNDTGAVAYQSASVPRKQPLYKKKYETQSTGGTCQRPVRHATKKPRRRLIKVEDDEFSIYDSDTSSGITSPLSTTSEPAISERHSQSSFNFDRDFYPDSPRQTENPLNTLTRSRHIEEGSTDSGNVTWYTSNPSLEEGDLAHEMITNHIEQNYDETVRPQMIQEYLHSVKRDNVVHNKRTFGMRSDIYSRSRSAGSGASGTIGKQHRKSRSVQDFNVIDTFVPEERARSMYDEESLKDEGNAAAGEREWQGGLFGTVSKISNFRPSLWSAQW